MICRTKLLSLALLALGVLSVYGCSKSPMGRAEDFLEAGMAAQAMPLLQLEIQSNPKNAHAHILLGEALLQSGDEAGAKDSFDRATLIDPGAQKQIAKMYFDTGNRMVAKGEGEADKGLMYLHAALERTHEFNKPIAVAYRRVGFEEMDARLLRSAAKLDPSLAADDSVAALTAIWTTSGDRAEVLRTFLTEHPTSAFRGAALAELADLALQRGDLNEASDDANQALKVGNAAAQAKARTVLAGVGEAATTKERTAADEEKLRVQRAELDHERQLAEQRAGQEQERAAALQRTIAAQAQAREAQATRERLEWESWKEGHRVLARISNTRGGFAKIFVNDSDPNREYGQVLTSTERSHPIVDSGWVDVTDKIVKGENTFRFRAKCNRCQSFAADFEVKVAGETVLGKHIDQSGVYDQTLSVTLPK